MNISITVQPISSVVRSPFLMLVGTKDPTISIIYINGDPDIATIMSESSWSAELHLDPGENKITIQGKDIAFNSTDLLVFYVILNSAIPTSYASYNYLDDKAAEVGLERLPGEKNLHLRNRILDAGTNAANSSYSGLMNGISRELSLNRYEDVLTIQAIHDSSTGGYRANNCYVTFEETQVTIEADELYIDKEKIIVDPGSLSALLSEEPLSSEEVTVTSLEGRTLKFSEYEIYDLNKIRIFSGDILVFVSYKYLEKIPVTGSTTVLALATAMEAITGIHTLPLINVAVTSGYDSHLAKNLIRQFRLHITEEPVYIDLASHQLFDLSSSAYRDSMLNEHGTHFGTQLEAYAARARSKGRIFLKDTLLDVDRLVNLDETENLATLPNLFDPVLQHYKSADPTDITRYTRKDFDRGGGETTAGFELSAAGLKANQIKAGRGLSHKMLGVD